jgi:predicted transcriptional regulator
MATEHVDVPLEPALWQQLAALAHETDRSEAELLSEAVAQFLEFHRWQRERIDQALAAADRGDFATPEDVTRVFEKYRLHS